ncbi:MAG: rRNA maturation RNase YbeY [Sphaerochaetaceae bacterium]
MVEVEVLYGDLAYSQLAPAHLVVPFLQKVFALQGITSGEVSVLFASESVIKEMNMRFRNKNESTDILSFVQEEDDGFPVFEQNRYLGDIIISLEDAKRNCQKWGVDEQEELQRLLIHGSLHLNGYDHQSNDSQEPMLIRQEQMLKELQKENWE